MRRLHGIGDLPHNRQRFVDGNQARAIEADSGSPSMNSVKCLRTVGPRTSVDDVRVIERGERWPRAEATASQV
jgi:hypothetical protein